MPVIDVFIDILSILTHQNEARQQNHKEVVEEDKRNKLPSNWEARKRQADWIMKDEEARKDAQANVSRIIIIIIIFIVLINV